METLQGLVICRPAVRAKNGGVSTRLVNIPLTKAVVSRSALRGSKGICQVLDRVDTRFPQPCGKRGGSVRCSFSSSSDGKGSMAENFSENDEDYVNSSVIEAVEVKSGSDGFKIKMRDGRHLRCVHNNPEGLHLPDNASYPAIVLKMEDGSNLLLPIIVMEVPARINLMAAVRNVQFNTPTIYQVVKKMIDEMGYQVRLVRLTERVQKAYVAQLYLTKVGDEKESISLDLRPSDAINIAVRCKVPIQVNRLLAHFDGMKVLEPTKPVVRDPLSKRWLLTELDRPDGQLCLETIEFNFVRNMMIATVEERYRDAAQWKKKLMVLRAKRRSLA